MAKARHNKKFSKTKIALTIYSHWSKMDPKTIIIEEIVTQYSYPKATKHTHKHTKPKAKYLSSYTPKKCVYLA